MEYNKLAKSEKTVQLFTEMMISRMQEMKASDWKMGWMAGKTGMSGMPQNISGRNYSGLNSLFLQWETIRGKYNMPVFLTFLQAQKEGLRIRPGSKSFPVLYWALSIKDKDGNKMSEEDYRSMSAKERSECNVKAFLRSFTVFNVDQTNIQEVKPELYGKLKERFQPEVSMDVNGMYKNRAIDRMIATQEWVCPIKPSNTARDPYYSPAADTVVVPMKYRFKVSNSPEEIFKDGMEYYSSALHEMAHSTGTASRLNRETGSKFGDAKYAREELVAELTAAMVGNTMGFDKRILNNNAAYLDGWLKALREDPRYIVSVMSDVNKASHMIFESIDRQKIALGERPILYADQQMSTAKSRDLSEGQSVRTEQAIAGKVLKASVFKTPEGEYTVQATVNGKALDPLTIDRETGAKYMNLPSGEGKNAVLAQIVQSSYGNRLQMNPKSDEHHSQSLKL